MDKLAPFETLAQIALGIAGFSGVVVAVAQRPTQSPRSDSLRILSLLVVSLGSLMLALLPSGLALAGVRRALIWRIGSGAAVLFWLAWTSYFPRRIRQQPQGVQFPAPVLALLILLSFVNFVVQALNAAGLFRKLAASVYYFGIVWSILLSAAIFANIVFRRPRE